MKAGEHKGNQASLWQVAVLLPWAIVDLNSSGWTECPMGCLGAWVHLGTWRIWASSMVPSWSLLLSLPLQSSHPAGVLSRAWARLPFWTVPQKDTRDGGTSHQVMAQALRVSALLGLDQRFEPRIFMPGVVPGDVFHNTLWTTVFSVWVHWASVSYKNCNNSNWRQST